MPNLAKQFELINQKTSFTFTADEVYAALDEAGLFVYQKVLKENRGFFVKIDETNLVLNPGVEGQDQIYNLPVDFSQMLHLAERLQSTPTARWRPMEPTNLGKTFDDELDHWLDWGAFESGSRFKYATFLSAVNTTGPIIGNPQQQQISITPIVDQTRNTQMIYSAKWVPIVDSTSNNMLPDEGTYAQMNYALAALTGDIDDTREGTYANRAKLQLNAFLQWCADRQLQQGPTVKTELL